MRINKINGTKEFSNKPSKMEFLEEAVLDLVKNSGDKELVLKYGLQNRINVVENVVTKVIRFEYNDYVLKKDEIFLDEETFWTKPV